MIHLVKANFKKIVYLKNNQIYLIATFLLSILFGILFLFTIDLTAGKDFTKLSSIEIIDITFLGIDVISIMLIIFAASYIAKEFSTGVIHTSLAITPLRHKFFIAKMLFTAKLSILITLAFIGSIILIDHVIITANNMEELIFNKGLLLKFIGALLMPLFYSLLSVAATFYFQSTSGGISFALGVMFIPALVKMFSTDISDIVLPLLPETSLHAFTGGDANLTNPFLLFAILKLMFWIIIPSVIGLWKFNKADF